MLEAISTMIRPENEEFFKEYIPGSLWEKRMENGWFFYGGMVDETACGAMVAELQGVTLVIHSIYVAPGYRGLGVATELLFTLEDMAHLYYIPSILGGSVSIAVLWRFLFKTDGLINMILGKFGVAPFNWLGSTSGAFWVIVLLKVWQFGSPMVIFLAALKSVPEDLYEAASLDGATKLRQFVKITLPLISPMVFYNFVTQLCNKFQEFNGPYIITQGGPLRSTTLVSLLVYNNAFKSYDMGYASAIAWLLFIIIMTFTAVAFISQKYWVYYSDEDGR